MNVKVNPEQSTAKRHLTKEPARIEVYGKREVLFCRMNNLSSTGAFFEVLNSLYIPKIGDIVRVTINLKQVNKTHIINGEVVWFKGTGLGVSFLKQKELLEKLSK